jgi:hypothetical protein
MRVTGPLGIRRFSIVAVLALSACSAAQDAVTQATRDTAKGVVNGIVEQRFPGLNARPITDCIIDAASVSEILTIASASVAGVDAQTIDTVVGISQRPDTVKCIAKSGLAMLS